MPDLSRSILKNSLVLGIFAIVTVGIIAITQQSTAKRIEQAQRHAQNLALAEVLPKDLYDNDLLASQIELKNSLLGTDKALPAYVASKNNQPSALVLQVIAPDGYSGTIKLLIGIRLDGQVTGVRVLQHKETPGLGDKIELSKSPWILSFTDKSLANPQTSGWGVKKDQGAFDQFAGATITPRAVVKAVHNSLVFFEHEKNQILMNYAQQHEVTP
ncbi:electron transport complex subunit RsxG [Pseudomonas sp. F1_0610]|uniref:electron transport complex subunit RsxG n=1 Tax=Pseudomonas sp. F1_0610 TaxID=3114284 RepID=UPI0039C49DD4